MKNFVRVKDWDGVQHLIKPGRVVRLSESLPPNDPPSVHIYLDDSNQSIRVVGSLDSVGTQLELYQ